MLFSLYPAPEVLRVDHRPEPCLRMQVVEQQLSDIKKLEAGVCGFPVRAEVPHAPKTRRGSQEVVTTCQESQVRIYLIRATCTSVTKKSAAAAAAAATAQPHSSSKFDADHKCTGEKCSSIFFSSIIVVAFIFFCLVPPHHHRHHQHHPHPIIIAIIRFLWLLSSCLLSSSSSSSFPSPHQQISTT